MKRTTRNHANWRKLKHHKPKNNRLVLIFAKSCDPKMPFISIGWWNSKQKRFFGIVDCWASAITHWMPLPKAPRK